MAITIKINGDKTINFDHLSNIATEFLGRAERTKLYTLLVEFDNNAYAQQYSKAIEPYLKHLSQSNTEDNAK